MNPLISVIIPTYNGARFIEVTIRSVLTQTFQDFEIIVVDDGSTDETPLILKKLAQEDSRIHIESMKNSGGPTKPANFGIGKARGTYIAFLDHDDLWKPNKLEQVMDVFKTIDGTVDIVCSAIEIFYEQTGITKLSTLDTRDRDITEKLLAGSYYNTFSMMVVKKEVFDTIGLLDTSLLVFADYEFVVRALSRGKKIEFIAEPLITYRMHDGNTSSLDKNLSRRIHDLVYIVNTHKTIFDTHLRAHARVFSAIARLYLQNKDTPQALTYYHFAIALQPFNIKGYLRMVGAFFGISMYNRLSSIFILRG